ncbi:hypothetical protein NHQ30_006679 [Ciborinia camelliae]|nr:hypothetical protein NHQ30_006679 [Ciborinia camelliae]
MSNSSNYPYTAPNESTDEKEKRKREYNRLAQREFRRRRKEHLRSLEQAQKEQSSEQSEIIERLSYQNEKLQRENEALWARSYGSTTPSQDLLLQAAGQLPADHRRYSLSPSISGTSASNADSPRGSFSSDMMSMGAMPMTSAMISPSYAYVDSAALSSQPYNMAMVHQPGLHLHNSQSSPETSGYTRDSRSTMELPNLQSPSINIPRAGGSSNTTNQQLIASSSRQRLAGSIDETSYSVSMAMVPYDLEKARTEIQDLFRPLLKSLVTNCSPIIHLAVLHTIVNTLPPTFKPSDLQLQTPHYYAIDMIASPSLRYRLMNIPDRTARNFIGEFGSFIGKAEDIGQVIIWGEDPYDELSWEISQPLLVKWGWLLGQEMIDRSNAWRTQRELNEMLLE